jgi:hypothetical protein
MLERFVGKSLEMYHRQMATTVAHQKVLERRIVTHLHSLTNKVIINQPKRNRNLSNILLNTATRETTYSHPLGDALIVALNALVISVVNVVRGAQDFNYGNS